MKLDKPYWIDDSGNIIYFERISLQYLRNIIGYIERRYKDPKQHYTYQLALKIYHHRESLLPIPIVENRKTIGWSKNDKIYMLKEYASNHMHDEVIRCDLERRFLMETAIEIGLIK